MTGCITEEKEITEDINYTEEKSDYDFNKSSYNETQLLLSERDKPSIEGSYVIHMKTFAPSTNYDISIDRVYISKNQTSIFGITPIGNGFYNKIIVEAKLSKTGDFGGSAITPLTKKIVVNESIPNLNKVELKINNTMGGNKTVIYNIEE